MPETLRDEAAIIKAINDLEVMGLDPLERETYEAEVKAAMVDKGQLEYAQEKGRQEGKEELLSMQIEQLFGFTSLADLESWLLAR